MSLFKKFFVSLLFTSTLLNAQSVINITDGTTLDVAEHLIDGLYNYGWSSTVYTQAELGSANTLNSICWFVDEDNLNGNCPSCNYTYGNIKVYLAHYNSTVFPDDAMPGSSYTGVTNWTLVFDGSVHFTANDTWQGVSFAVPFSYNGTSNLIVHVENRSNNGAVNEPWFYYMSDPVTSHYRNKSKWQDTSFPNGNADNPGSLSKYKYTQCKFNAACNVGTILPVELLKFEGSCNYEKVVLRWTTASEINNSYFNVKRALGKNNFETIALVKANGNSNTLINYNYEDNINSSEEIYYNLSQTDLDGKQTDLKTIVINNCNKWKISLMLNTLTDNEMSGIIYSEEQISLKLEMFDINGKPLGSAVRNFEKGANGINFPMHNIAAGIYLFKASDDFGNIILLKKIVKQ